MVNERIVYWVCDIFNVVHVWQITQVNGLVGRSQLTPDSPNFSSGQGVGNLETQSTRPNHAARCGR